MSRLERTLAEALHAAGTSVEPSSDLFERVTNSIDADRSRRRFRRRLAGAAASAVALLTTVVALQGGSDMDWWIFEAVVFVVLVAIAVTLGPFIKRFGRSYAADVFRSNPSTGKSFIVLTDFAYYLIFSAYILFTTTVDRPRGWAAELSAEQFQQGVVRFGGILLIIGALHGLNLVVLPVIGRLLTLNRRLDQQMRERAEQDLDS